MGLKKFFGVLSVLGLSVGLCGCPLVLVGAGAAGGYAIGKDSVENHYERSADHVYRHSLAVAKEMGRVTLDDRDRGVIKAEINEAHVTITVKKMTPRTVELKVKARGAMMPKVEVAQEVYNKIHGRL